MATDAYMIFKDYSGKYLASESLVDLSKSQEALASVFTAAKTGNIFEVEDYSFNIEQTLNIGSQSTGAGAGKVTFNAFSITRKIDISSAPLYQAACAGTPYQLVSLGLRKSGGGDVSGVMFLRFDFKKVAVKTISWAHDEESPKETIEFEYGGLQVRYCQQKADGSLDKVIIGGWDRTVNMSDQSEPAS